MAGATLPTDPDVTVVIVCGNGVRRFLIVVKMVAAAVASDTLGEVDIHCPARDIKGMNAVVCEFATTIEPMPVPVVVD